MTRRRPAQRLTSALIGAIITALGLLTGALLSGRSLDTELIAIVSLAAIGVWLVMTALLSARRPRTEAWASAHGAYAAAEQSPAAEFPSDKGAPPHGEAPLTAAARSAASKAKAKGADAS